MSRPSGSGRRVALVLDHPLRDLAGLVLTALELCRHDLTVYLVPLNLQQRELAALAPDLVVLNYFRRGTERVIRELKEAGIRYAALDTEGGVWSDCQAYSELLWTDPVLLAGLERACMWGARLGDHLVDAGILERRQIAVTGCPRFDFYAPQWQGALTEHDSAAPQLLINTNFSATNPRFASPEQNRQQFIERFGWEPSRVDEYWRLEQCAIQGMTGLAGQLATDFPALRLVFRPHPFEDSVRYREALAGHPNVVVDNTPTIQQEIFRSRLVVQRSCSTAVESGLAGIPTLSPRWVPTPAEVDIAEASSDPCESYDVLRAKVKDIVAGCYQSPPAVRDTLAAVTRDWFYRVDGEAHRRVAAALLESLPAQREVRERACRRIVYGLDRRQGGWLERAGRRVRWGLGLSPDWSFRTWRRDVTTPWTRSAKAFDVVLVHAAVADIQRAERRLGLAPVEVEVQAARDSGDYLVPTHGFTVSLRPRR